MEETHVQEVVSLNPSTAYYMDQFHIYWLGKNVITFEKTNN